MKEVVREVRFFPPKITDFQNKDALNVLLTVELAFKLPDAQAEKLYKLSRLVFTRFFILKRRGETLTSGEPFGGKMMLISRGEMRLLTDSIRSILTIHGVPSGQQRAYLSAVYTRYGFELYSIANGLEIDDDTPITVLEREIKPEAAEKAEAMLNCAARDSILRTSRFFRSNVYNILEEVIRRVASGTEHLPKAELLRIAKLNLQEFTAWLKGSRGERGAIETFLELSEIGSSAAKVLHREVTTCVSSYVTLAESKRDHE